MATIAKVSNRQIRTAVNHQAAEVDAHRNLLRQVINDELVSRRRIDALELWREEYERFRDMTLLQRVRWIMRGWR